MKSIFLKFIFFYKKIHFFPSTPCRFTPTCSEYTYQAIEKYGTINGLLKGFKRILKCNPWSKPGLDPLN